MDPQSNATEAAETTTDAPAAKDQLSAKDQAVAILKGDVKPPDETEPTQETKPAETVEAPKEQKPDFSKRFEELSRRDRKLREERERLKAERALIDPILRAKEGGDAIAALQALGFSYEQATEQVLSGKKIEGPPKVNQEVETLKAKLEQMERAAIVAQQQAMLEAYRSKVLETAKVGGEKYALLRDNGGEALALEAIDRHYRQTGEWMGGSPEKAIEVALDATEASFEEIGARLLQSEKFKRKFNLQKQEVSGPQANGSKLPAAPKTLTNSQAAVAPPRSAPVLSGSDDYRTLAARVLRGG